MKLDHLTFAVLAAALACGCSATTSKVPQSASIPNVAGTTSLMSAELAGPAPKVGKAHSTLQAVDEADSIDANANDGDEGAPKEARRSDGSHRSGSFGMSSK